MSLSMYNVGSFKRALYDMRITMAGQIALALFVPTPYNVCTNSYIKWRNHKLVRNKIRNYNRHTSLLRSSFWHNTSRRLHKIIYSNIS